MDLLSTGKGVVQMGVVFVLFHVCSNIDTSQSLLMVLTITTMHWHLFFLQLNIMVTKNGLASSLRK